MAEAGDNRLLKEAQKQNEMEVRRREQRTSPNAPSEPQPVPDIPVELWNSLSPDVRAEIAMSQSEPKDEWAHLGFSADAALDLPVAKPVLGLGGLGPPTQIPIGQWLTDFTGLGRNQIATYQSLLQRAGYIEPDEVRMMGRTDFNTLAAMRNALADASRNRMSPEAWLSELASGREQQSRRGGGGGGGGGRARPALQLQVSNRDDLKTLLDNAAQSVIGRNLESLGINPDEFADAVQAAERDIQTRSFNMQVNNQPGEIEQMESASARARRFLEDKAAPQIEARQMAGAMSVIENLVRGG